MAQRSCTPLFGDPLASLPPHPSENPALTLTPGGSQPLLFLASALKVGYWLLPIGDSSRSQPASRTAPGKMRLEMPQLRTMPASMGASSSKDAILIPAARIDQLNSLVRGHRVMLDRDPANLYGVQTRVLNQAVPIANRRPGFAKGTACPPLRPVLLGGIRFRRSKPDFHPVKRAAPTPPNSPSTALFRNSAGIRNTSWRRCPSGNR